MRQTKSLYLTVVSAQESLFGGEVKSLQVTGVEGEFGVLPGHAPLLTSIKPGSVRLLDITGAEHVMYLSGGILEVQPNTVTILADVAIRAEELDEIAEQEAKHRAEQSIKNASKEKVDYSEAALQLASAVAKLRVIKLLRELRKRR